MYRDRDGTAIKIMKQSVPQSVADVYLRFMKIDNTTFKAPILYDDNEKFNSFIAQ